MTAMEQDPRELVAQLADKTTRWQAMAALKGLGREAMPALRDGLKDGHWEVRRWCAAFLDHEGGPECRPWLVPLLHDPKAPVRLWAVHTLACDRCIGGENPVDAVPHLIERLWNDESIRVRRMSACMLATQVPEPRTEAVFREILAKEVDRKLRGHATWGLKRCHEAGIGAERSDS